MHNRVSKGSVLVSAILSITLLALIITGILGIMYVSSEGIVRSGMHQRALAIADEGQEAVRSIRDSDFSELSNGTYGVEAAGGEWQFAGSSTVINGFTRHVEITELDDNTREVEVGVSWNSLSGATREITLVNRLTNWQAEVGGPPGGGPPGGGPPGGGPPGGGPPGQQ